MTFVVDETEKIEAVIVGRDRRVRRVREQVVNVGELQVCRGQRIQDGVLHGERVVHQATENAARLGGVRRRTSCHLTVDVGGSRCAGGELHRKRR